MALLVVVQGVVFVSFLCDKMCCVMAATDYFVTYYADAGVRSAGWGLSGEFWGPVERFSQQMMQLAKNINNSAAMYRHISTRRSLILFHVPTRLNKKESTDLLVFFLYIFPRAMYTLCARRLSLPTRPHVCVCVYIQETSAARSTRARKASTRKRATLHRPTTPN